MTSSGRPHFRSCVELERSDIWLHKGGQAQASGTCGACVNTCLSDYGKASCFPQCVLPTPELM